MLKFEKAGQQKLCFAVLIELQAVPGVGSGFVFNLEVFCEGYFFLG